MIETAADRLRGLAETDPVIAPLARLQADVLEAAHDSGWEQGLPPLQDHNLAQRIPLLHGATIAVDEKRLTALLRHLATAAPTQAPGAVEPLQQAVGALCTDPITALEASIVQDTARLQRIADDADVEAGLVATLAHLAALPLLQALGRQAAPLLANAVWEAGHCPTCAAWPSLVELRGLERQRWLRCGRCGAGWFSHIYACAYCGNADHKSIGYLAGEREREARRAETCGRCHGYLKAVATLGPLSAADLFVHDASTIELDVAALQRGYTRPAGPGFTLDTSVQPLSRRAGWAPWKR